ncbi:MAG TPA: protein kinase [Blastocatellia bacterium]|nr:protein kinase [Blastocatellia bacterium]
MVGRTVLHYKILKEIGKGGMGVVYKAEDVKLHRVVAIKALAADLVGDEKARARFLREARAASAIDHPNICTVYEINEAENALFIVMQYIEGKTLKKHIAGRPLPLEQALEFSIQLADALAEAHRRNVIHRDIKSSNVMLNERNQVKILDFGLAKLVRPSTSSSSDSLLIGDLTQVGSPFGTASYMSPEQAKGERADARSDIFSFGIVMYEMLTGRLPFKGKSSVDVMHSVMHDDPPPMGDGVPPRVQQIVLKALAKKPSERYQTTDQMLEDLKAALRGYYAEQDGAGADRIAALRSAKSSSRGKGLMGRMTSWMKGAFGKQPQPALNVNQEDSGSGGSSGTPDLTPSMWQSSDKKAIAIMPFKNLSGSPENDFYSFSLADSVITELAQLRDLIVRPSSYIAQYQNKDIDPRAVGAQLAVDAVLVGGYIKAGDRFRVTPQLVDVTSGEIVWSEKIDVDARDIITIQDTISRQIVEGLRVQTSQTEHDQMVKAPTASAEAYESYLKGRTTLYKYTTQTLDLRDLEEAVSLFERAIELDPGFALAHSGLGVCRMTYVLKGIGGPEYYAAAKESFNRALAIAPKLIEPRVKMVYIDLTEGNVEQARRDIRRLLRQAPNEPSVHSAAAYVYRLSGQYERALESWENFLKISPTEIVLASHNRARLYIYQLDWAKAEAEIARGLAFEPQHPILRLYVGIIAYHRGDIEKATRQLEEVIEKHPELHAYKLFLAYCYLAQGERERAFGLVDERVIETATADHDVAYWLATLYAMDNRADEAIEWLRRAIAMGNENYPWFAANPNWESLREDPRFKAIMEALRAKWEKLVEAG